MPVIVSNNRSATTRNLNSTGRLADTPGPRTGGRTIRTVGQDDAFGFENEEEKELILGRAFRAEPSSMSMGNAAPLHHHHHSQIIPPELRCWRSNKVDVEGGDDFITDSASERGSSSGGSCIRSATSVRHALYIVLTEPGSSWLAWGTSVTILLLIVLSSATFCLETIQGLGVEYYYSLGLIEWISIMVFSLEYIVKIVCAPSIWRAVRQPFNIIDFVSIVPFYITLIINPKSLMFWVPADEMFISGADTRIIRVIRLVRVFRVLKLGTHISKVELIILSVMESADMLVMLLFLLLLATVLCSTLIYYAEHSHWDYLYEADLLDESLIGPNGDANPFGSIPESFWWCIVTLMTVGYGDVVPLTPWGKLVACFAMIVSIVIMALPISVIGAAFTQQWVAYKDKAGVIERSQRVWPRFQALNQMLSKQNEVLDDVVDTLHSTARQADVALIGFRNNVDNVTDLWETNDRAANQAQPASKQQLLPGRSFKRTSEAVDITESPQMKELLKQAAKTGFFANRCWAVLSDVRALSRMTQSEMVKIERAHFAYKGLKKWYDEGNVLQDEIDDLIDELQDVKSFLVEQSKQGQVGSSRREKPIYEDQQQ